MADNEMAGVDRGRLAELIERERAAYAANFPGSRAAFAAAGEHLIGGVPMTWMRMWPGGFPLYQATGPRRRRHAGGQRAVGRRDAGDARVRADR